MIGIWQRLHRSCSRSRPRPQRPKIGRAWEPLEERQLLDGGAGRDYILSGFTWSNPAKITYSFPADGVNWDFGTNNLNASLNSGFSGDSWKREFARALQTWAAAANINVVQTSDSNVNFNAYGKSQGDANFGDIRIGGYNFDDPKTLAQTYYPPPNSVSAAGDVEVNTGFEWKPGSSFDFYSVMLHETGHSFGLAHSPQATAVMNAVYGGVRTGLTVYDTEGIQALYGPRVPDPYNLAGNGTSAANAVDVSTSLKGTSGSLNGVWLTSIGDSDYYTITVPAINGASLQLTAAASGLSSLSPKISVFDTSQNLLGSQGNPNAWGDNVSVAIPGTSAGQRFIIQVTGATSDVFAVGSYQLQFSLTGGTPVTTPAPGSGGGGGSNPTPTPQPTPVPTPTPKILPDRLEPNNLSNQVTNLGVVSQTAITGLTLATTSDVDLFRFQTARAGTVTLLNTAGMTRVLNEAGRVIASGVGVLSFRATKPGSRFVLLVTPPANVPVADYAIGISVVPTGAKAPITTRKRLAAQTSATATSQETPQYVVEPMVTGWNYSREALKILRWAARRK